MQNLYREWFKKADNDLLNIRNNLNAEQCPADTVCYHSQQAAEKYLKGFLTYHGIEVERTHNLLILYQKCIEIDAAFSTIYNNLLNLNNYSSHIRYPDFIEEFSLDEAKEAYQDALIVKNFILSKV